MKVKIKIVRLRDDAVLPAYGTPHAAAMDLVAAIDGPIIVESLDRAIVGTGIAIELPEGYEAQIRARSGLSSKHGITTANGVGTIDADYRGEVGVILANISREPFTIEPGMRIAQLLVAPVERVTWDETDVLADSARGKGGYGSTGY